MKLLRALVLIASVVPVWAQYAGPAILSRGQVPSGIRSAQISFRPFVEILGVYDTGLTTVSPASASGQLAQSSAIGAEAVVGVSGYHQWRHTSLGLDYRGGFRHYNQKTYYDGTDQQLTLGLTHQLSRRMTFTLRQTAGMFARDFGFAGLQQSVPFDPTSTYIPTTDFFDNRTLYFSSQADFTYQRTARLSFNFGGDAFSAKRRSSSLYGVTGESARGDVQYRVARYTTVGLNYTFGRFSFSRGFGNSIIHNMALTYSVRLTRNVEASAYGGISRSETKYLQVVPIDPVIASIIGQGNGIAVLHRIDIAPNIGGRLSRSFRRGVASLSASRAITPGNGLFLTSATTTVSLGYSYSGLRRWSMSVNGNYMASSAISNVVGGYGGYSGGFTVSRQISRFIHGVCRVDARKYSSGDFQAYNRVIYRATLGFGFAPGDLPLRVW